MSINYDPQKRRQKYMDNHSKHIYDASAYYEKKKNAIIKQKIDAIKDTIIENLTVENMTNALNYIYNNPEFLKPSELVGLEVLACILQRK